MKKVITLIIALVATAGLISAIVLFEVFNIPGWSNVFATLLGAVIVYIPLPLLDLISGWRFGFVRMRISSDLRGKDYVRISFGYAFRVMVDGKYLLVKDKYGKYQSPGGCYKVTQEEKYYLRKKYHACADQSTPMSVTDTTKDDYRMRIPASKLGGFVTRFHTTKRRETYKNASREFREELIDTGILNKELFKEVEYSYLGQYQAPIARSPYFGVYELIFTDVLELIPTPEQEECLRQLLLKNEDYSNPEFRFVTEDQILHCGMDRDKKMQAFIMENAFKITDESFKDLKRCPRKLTTYKININ